MCQNEYLSAALTFDTTETVSNFALNARSPQSTTMLGGSEN
jgi:hypothetical protein